MPGIMPPALEVAKASLTLEQEQEMSMRRPAYRLYEVEDCIVANRISINTLREIFGDGDEGGDKHWSYETAIRQSVPVSPPGVPDKQTEKMKWTLYDAIDHGYSALSKDNYYKRKLAIRDPAQV